MYGKDESMKENSTCPEIFCPWDYYHRNIFRNSSTACILDDNLQKKILLDSFKVRNLFKTYIIKAWFQI